MADRMRALAALGMLAEEAEGRGDVRAVERLQLILDSFTEVLGLAAITEEARRKDRNRKRDSRNSAESADTSDGGTSLEFPGNPGNSGDAQKVVQGPKEKLDNTPTVRELAQMAGGGKLVVSIDAAALAYGEHWPDFEAFLRRRDFDKWQAWLDEAAKLCGPGSQFSATDLGRVCSDDRLLEKPLGSAFALRQFLGNARQERITANAERSPPGAVRGKPPRARPDAAPASNPAPPSDPDKAITWT